MDTPYDLTPRLATERMLQHRSFDGSRLRPETDFLQSRRPVLVNDDCQVVLAARLEGMAGYFYKNADVVMESSASFECKVLEVKTLGNGGGAGQLVIAEVLCIHVKQDLLGTEGRAGARKFDLLARLGDNWYARVQAENLLPWRSQAEGQGFGWTGCRRISGIVKP
jgi:hypothetical protein